MRRREFIKLIGGSAAAWPLAARAQQPEHMRLVGVLMSVEENAPEGKTELSAFSQALAESGWTDGRNFRMEVRWGSGDVNRTRTFAKELVALQPDVILAQGTLTHASTIVIAEGADTGQRIASGHSGAEISAVLPEYSGSAC